MKPDLLRSIVLWATWLVLTIGLDIILVRVVPGIDMRWASLWIIAALSLVLAIGVGAARWWHAVGYTPTTQWRDTAWLAIPALLTLAPLVMGIKTLDASTYGVLIAGYALTGFAEETMFRGVLVKVLEKRSPLMIATITAILFGLVHLGNIVIRGEVAITLAQAVGAAAFGFGYAALRLRTNTIVPLIVTHALTDLFLQMGNLPLIPVAVGQDVVLFAVGLYLLAGRRTSSAVGS
jgi:membrane protease YdiL (CAAX protease family)